MTKYIYDEEGSERFHMDVVHEIDIRPGSLNEWLDAMRRLNAINDPLGRSIVALHRDCGSGGRVRLGPRRARADGRSHELGL